MSDLDTLRPVLTVDEVADLLRVSHQHVRNLARQGVLPSVPNMGRRTLFTAKAILSFLERAS